MAEIVKMEERVVPINATEEKKMKILDDQVVVAVESNTGHKEGAAVGNANSTEGAPQVG